MPNAAPADPTLANAVNAADRRTLLRVFEHPLSHNLSCREVVKLLNAIGSADEQHNGEVILRAGGAELKMKKPRGKDLTAAEVMDLRHFLTAGGWAPDAPAPESAQVSPAATDLMIVIDHAGAKVYRIDAVTGTEQPGDPDHLLHHVDRKQHDADREETFPGDMHFFEQVAMAAAGGRIVVIGHGTGQSDEAGHLSDYLQSHHREVYDRIAQTIAADLPHTSTPELLELARQALHREAGDDAALPDELYPDRHLPV